LKTFFFRDNPEGLKLIGQYRCLDKADGVNLLVENLLVSNEQVVGEVICEKIEFLVNEVQDKVSAQS
jgi:hypothetical protein